MLTRMAELICQGCGGVTTGRVPSAAGTTMPACESCGGKRQVVRIVSSRTARFRGVRGEAAGAPPRG